MNYENIYNKFYNTYYDKIEKMIKNFLEKKCNQNKPYHKSSNEIFSYFTDVFNKKYKFENSKLNELQSLFLNRYSEYETNHINEIFTNEIKNSFDKIASSELPKNYNYFKLIQRIALLEVAKEITRLLSNNRDLLVLYFKHNRFDIFEIRDIENTSLENYPHFIELNKIDYPDLYIQQNEDFEDIIEYEESDNVEKLPLIIALLNEVGFFELPKIKSMSISKQSRIIAIIQQTELNKYDNRIRQISGNISVLNPNSQENQTKFTSFLNVDKAKDLIKKIKGY